MQLKHFKHKVGWGLLMALWTVGPMEILAQEDEKKQYNQIHFFQIKQENDLYQYWYQSDKNFTDGLHFELAHRIFNNKASDWFLIGMKDTPYKDFEFSIGQDIFTPTNTDSTFVDSTDRPYTGLLYFTYSKYTNNLYLGRKLSSNFYFGLQGKGALGEEVQNGVHKILGNKTSKGWDNQLGTGLMLDYDIMYDHLLPTSNKFMETSAYGKAHVGTIYNYVSAGLSLKIGHYGDSYINTIGNYNGRNNVHYTVGDIEKIGKSKRRLMPRHIRTSTPEHQVEYLNKRTNRKFQLFMFFTLESHYTIYDGTLEGSLIPLEESKYEFATGNYERLVLVGEYSIHLQYGHFKMSFNRFLETDNVNTDQLFGFGEFVITYVFY